MENKHNIGTNLKKLSTRIIIVILGLFFWFSTGPQGVSMEAWRLFVLFMSVILSVLTNAFPILWATIVALLVILTSGILPPSTAFSGFTQSFMLLIVTAFLAAKAVIRSGLGRRVAMWLISRFGKSTLHLAYCIFVTDLIIAPAIPSNTARSGILFPIVNALALDTGSLPDEKSRKRTGSYIMMCSIASLSISSALWLTGMAGNFIAAEIAKSFGVTFTFFNWLLTASLPCLMALALLPYLIQRLYPPEIKDTTEVMISAQKTLGELGPLKRQEWITLSVFALMIALWGLSGILHISLALVGILGLTALFVTGVYRFTYLKDEKGDALETYIWFSIMYMMSTQLNELGFIQVISQEMSGIFLHFHWFYSYLLLTLVYVFVHYLFVSQTAHLLALYAIFLEVAIQSNVPAALMAFMLAFATNYFSAITPQASSSNIIFVGSGYIHPGEVYKIGLFVTIINLTIFLLCTPWIIWITT
ncbi:MAG: DASS family sodium-coupled anion symporter [Saprospiraceae bacterium]|nr:DASS family sodium-coupled anion symporter [Saprospiraceae bacterium]